ncbi:hypothetical protein M445_05485 [Vibrio owensii 47666-1]|nr:hypothetical protein M445_05485 [Vibrio owensii 47666-1]
MAPDFFFFSACNKIDKSLFYMKNKQNLQLKNASNLHFLMKKSFPEYYLIVYLSLIHSSALVMAL